MTNSQKSATRAEAPSATHQADAGHTPRVTAAQPAAAATTLRGAGNQALQRLVSGVDRRALPSVGPPNDRYEREAEAVAAGTAPVQQAARTSYPQAAPARVPPLLDGGTRLPAAERRVVASRLGHEVPDVRIHADGRAAALATAVRAEAFAYGDDIYFAAGRFAPGTAGGRDLLAHELTHVAQGRRGAPPVIRRVPGRGGASDLIGRHTGWTGSVDAETLGQRLFELAWMSPDHYAFVVDVMDTLSDGDRDDVAIVFTRLSREDNLDEFAKTADGRRMLTRLQDELLSGLTRVPEQQQAIRLRQALARQASAEAGLAQGQRLLEAAFQAPVPVAAGPQPAVPDLSPQQVLERLRLLEAVLNRVRGAYPQERAVLDALAQARAHITTTRDTLSGVASPVISRRVVASQTVAERIAALLPTLDLLIERHRTGQGASGPALASLTETVRGYYLQALGLVGSDGAGDAFNRAEQAAARLPRAMTELQFAAFEGRAPTYSLLEPSRRDIVAWVGRIRASLDTVETDAQALAAARAANAADVSEREQALTRTLELIQLSLEALQHWEQALRAWEYLAGSGNLIPEAYRSIGYIRGRCAAMRDAAYAGDLATLRQRVAAHRTDPAVADFYRGLPIIAAGSQMLTSLGITLVAAMATGGIGGLARLAIGARVSAGLAFAGTAAIEALTFTAVTQGLGAVVPGAPASGDFLSDLIWNFGLFAALRGLSHGVRAGLTARGLETLERPIGFIASAGLLQGYGILRFTIEEGRLPTGDELDRMTADNLVMLLAITVTTSRMQRAIDARARLQALRTFQRQYGWRFQEFEAGHQRLIEDLRAMIASGQATDPTRVDALRQRAQRVDALFRELVAEVRADRTISLERARAELRSLGLDLESASSELLATSLGLPEQVGLRRGGGLEQYTYSFGSTTEVANGLRTLGATDIVETLNPVGGLRALTASLPNRPPIYLVERAPAQQRAGGSTVGPPREITTLTNVQAQIAAASVLPQYTVGSGFSGAYNPATGTWVAVASGDASLVSGQPVQTVPQFGGHAAAEAALVARTGVSNTSSNVGFVLLIEPNNTLRIRWNSRTINERNFGSREAPLQHRAAIRDAVARETGWQVTE